MKDEELPESERIPELLTLEEAAAMVRVTPEWLADRIYRQRGPTVIRLGRLGMFIRRADLRRWLDAHVVEPKKKMRRSKKERVDGTE